MAKLLKFWILLLGTLLLELGLLGSQAVLGLSPEQVADLPPGIHLEQSDRPPDAPLPSPSSATLMATDYGQPEYAVFEDLVADAEQLDGLFTLYRDRQTHTTYLEIQPDQLNQSFLGVMTLESGLGELGLYRGMPINSFLVQFRHVQNHVQVVVPNLNFRTPESDPQFRSVQRAFSDSVLYTIPIQSIHPTRQSLLINLDTFLTQNDLADLTNQFYWVLAQDYSLNSGGSYIGEVRAFPGNIELETVYAFSAASNGLNSPIFLSSLPDQRGFELSVRYSFSTLPQADGYRPRLADDRVGYFISAHQDLSNPRATDSFVRYINRWRLEPLDPTLPLSPPKQPIVYWIENTVPVEYRRTIRDGILMWNAAFEQAGFIGAIEVRQMPDDADWDPADVRYNTIRWSPTFETGLVGIGPMQVNPITGEILDADILINANAIQWLERDTGLFVEQQAQTTQAAMVPFCSRGMASLYRQWQQVSAGMPLSRDRPNIPSLSQPQTLVRQELCFGAEATQQLGLGKLSLAMVHNALPSSEATQDYIHQFLRQLVAHEVGHTLGLRHNFRGSTMLPMEDLHDVAITRNRGLTGSVMDYLPVNLAPQGSPQGDYFSTVVGPYDRWAIDYGYRYLEGTTPQTERRALEQLAQQASEPGYAYATDEDSIDITDPTANPWDLSGSMLDRASAQLQTVRQLWQLLPQRYPLPGESYSALRDRFETVFYAYFGEVFNLTRYIGGRVFNRDRYGDPGGRRPFEPLPLEQQRQALDTLNRAVFAPDSFVFPPTLLNQLAPSRWYHWGSYPDYARLDYPIYDDVLFLQSFVLSDLLSSERLARLRDGELHGTSPSLTIPDLFDSVEAAIWQELNPDTDTPQISSLRRGLQRQYLDILSHIVLRNFAGVQNAANFTDFIVALQTLNAPEDAQVVARYHLRHLDGAIAQHMRRHRGDLDTLTQAHLEDVRDRIEKVLNAEIQSG